MWPLTLLLGSVQIGFCVELQTCLKLEGCHLSKIQEGKTFSRKIIIHMLKNLSQFSSFYLHVHSPIQIQCGRCTSSSSPTMTLIFIRGPPGLQCTKFSFCRCSSQDLNWYVKMTFFLQTQRSPDTLHLNCPASDCSLRLWQENKLPWNVIKYSIDGRICGGSLFYSWSLYYEVRFGVGEVTLSLILGFKWYNGGLLTGVHTMLTNAEHSTCSGAGTHQHVSAPWPLTNQITA